MKIFQFQILNHQLPPLQAQLQLLQTKDDEAKRMRVHVHRMSQPPVETLTEQMNHICELVHKKLNDLAEADKHEKIVNIGMELEKLRTEPYGEAEIVKLEEQLQQLPVEDEGTQSLLARVQELRTKKEEREALEKELEGKLAELLNHMNVIRTNLSPIMEEEEPGKQKAQLGIDEQISALELALNETMGEMLPAMNDLLSRSQQEHMIIPSIQSELENMQNFAEKCKVKVNFYFVRVN